MKSKEQALAEALNTVYTSLFGMDRDTMLAQARQHPHYSTGAGLPYAVGDEDESMRDCFSETALQALNEVESKLAGYLMNYMLVSSTSLDTALKSLNRDLQEECEKVKAKYGEFEVWSQ